MVCVPFLFPVKGCDAINIDCGDNGRNDILKQWFLPFLYFQSGSGVCFFYKAIPAPSKTAAAEQCKDERAERKDIGGNDKIPEIQPCCAVCKRLKMDEIKTKCGGQGKNSRTMARIFSQTPSTVDMAAKIINRKNSDPQRRPPDI